MTQTRDYYRQATGWAIDTQELAARSRRTAWVIAAIAVAMALFEAVALAMLVPFKTVQTITLLVDRQTGFVQAVDPFQPQRIKADDALTNAWLAQYVTAREGFDRATISGAYRKVALWSAGRARAAYLAGMPASNPDSPFNRVSAGSSVDATVKSVSRISPGIALVRFDTSITDRSGQHSFAQPWVAIVRFRYVDAPMQFADRLINPLGFQVTGYRRDPEALPPAATETAAPAPVIIAPASDIGGRSIINPRVYPGHAPRLLRENRPVGSTRPMQPMSRSIRTRDVPINEIPMGSPLSPAVAPTPDRSVGAKP